MNESLILLQFLGLSVILFVLLVSIVFRHLIGKRRLFLIIIPVIISFIIIIFPSELEPYLRSGAFIRPLDAVYGISFYITLMVYVELIIEKRENQKMLTEYSKELAILQFKLQHLEKNKNK